ncbi:hypothetical protein BHE74_00058238 [Ensete ventricosum]|nr:hypothetical protein BHE74_00058238 [Ensete ventricosum]
MGTSVCNGPLSFVCNLSEGQDRGGIVRGNAIQAILYREGQDHTEGCIPPRKKSNGGDLIIQRYDQSGWRVGLLQCSHSLKGARQVRGRSRRWDFRGVIDPLLSWRESIGRKRGRGGGECISKLQVPRQGRRAEAKELHKTSVDGLLIKITRNEGLRVDAGVLDQGTK